MSNLKDAIERIKALECPTGDIGHRVAGILEDYDVSNRSEIKFSRDKRLDRNGVEAYRVKISRDGESIVVLAESGLDDYVARIVDAYIS